MNEGILAQHPNIMWWFVGLILLLIGLDLFLLRRSDTKTSLREAVGWSLAWVAVAMIFNGWIAWYLGISAATSFLTGYIVEMSLSIDNLFVFILIFSSFRIPLQHQHRLLFWGILGALIMRAICISVGVAALERFHWLQYIFAAILVFAGVKSLLEKEDEDTPKDPSKGRISQFIQKFIPLKADYEGRHFFVRENGILHATPGFIALILIELSDVIFAVDSIPAVLAISQDPFIVYSSNIFAILGLRNLYFVLAELLHVFRFLGTAVSFILIFIGIKMGVGHWVPIPTVWTLGVILTFVIGSIVLSLMFREQESKRS